MPAVSSRAGDETEQHRRREQAERKRAEAHELELGGLEPAHGDEPEGCHERDSQTQLTQALPERKSREDQVVELIEPLQKDFHSDQEIVRFPEY